MLRRREQSHVSHLSAGWPATLGTIMDLALIFELLIDDPKSRAAVLRCCTARSTEPCERLERHFAAGPYATDLGLDQIPELASKVGPKVIQGICLVRDRQKNATQISTGIRLAQQYPQTITVIVVGNEVLLHREMTASDLVALIRSVKGLGYEDVGQSQMAGGCIAKTGRVFKKKTSSR